MTGFFVGLMFVIFTVPIVLYSAFLIKGKRDEDAWSTAYLKFVEENVNKYGDYYDYTVHVVKKFLIICLFILLFFCILAF